MVECSDSAVVAVREGFNDGEAESGPAGGAGAVCPSESVKGVWDKSGFESRAVVADVDGDRAGAIGLGPDGDGWCAVFGGVVDEVADDAVEVVRVGADLLPGRAWFEPACTMDP